jgi:hypothetical protein
MGKIGNTASALALALSTALMVWSPLQSRSQTGPSGTLSPAETITIKSSPWTVKDRSPHQTEWVSLQEITNARTRKVTRLTNSVIELASGLNVLDQATGGYQSAVIDFEITDHGAEAKGTQHSLRLAANINTPRAVELGLDGTRLVNQPLALGYYDPVDGSMILLSEIQDSIGILTAPAEIVYTNCFKDISASIRIRNFLSGMEADLILHEAPPPPEAFGLSRESRLEMITEFFPGTPEPQRQGRLLRRENVPAKRAAMFEPDLVDETLFFENLRIGPGNAFTLESDPQQRDACVPHTKIPVAKRFDTTTDGRIILIEAVEHQRLHPLLTNLPPAAISTNAALRARSVDRLAQGLARPLPEQRAATQNTGRIRTARQQDGTELAALFSNPAVVIDYVIHNLNNNQGANNFVFESRQTYLVSGYFCLNGTTKIMPGAIIKFAQTWPCYLEVNGPLLCETEPSLPAIFTSKDDNSVGITVQGSTGNPSSYYAAAALHLNAGDYKLNHLRFLNAWTGISAEDATVEVRNSQFVHCWEAAVGYSSAIKFYNVLVKDFFYVVEGDGQSFSFHAEHLTAHSGVDFAYSFAPNPSFTLINSLLVDIGWDSFFPHGSPGTFFLPSPAGVFQSAGSGQHYLAGNQFRGIGSPAIDLTLRNDLAQRTTHAPQLLSGNLPSGTTRLIPSTPRNRGIRPDLGFSYEPIDYLVSGLNVPAGSTLEVTDGTVVAANLNPSWYGIMLTGGDVLAQGSPARPARFLRAQSVQELPNPVTPGFKPFLIETWSAGNSEVRLQFADFTSLTHNGIHFYFGNYLKTFAMSHSQVRGGVASAVYYGGQFRSIGWTNNLFERASIEVAAYQPLAAYFYNNLFFEGSLYFNDQGPTQFHWQVRDNVFDKVTLVNSGNYLGAWKNRFVSPTQPLPTSEQGIMISRPVYEAGPFGRYYLPNGSPLIDAGSRTANAAALHHFTTGVFRDKEGNSQVDIGLHYVFSNGSQFPADTDRDGIPDYLEDANGNGLADDASSYLNPDSNSNGIWDGEEMDLRSGAIIVVAPVGSVTHQPYVQVRGYALKSLRSVSYEVRNGSQQLTSSGEGYIIRQDFDLETRRASTNWVQFFDVDLTEGANTITLTATDMAGRTYQTTFPLTLDLAGDSTAPIVTHHWPFTGNGNSGAAKIASSSFTLRGQLDDPTAAVAVYIGGLEIAGIVDRDGLFWVEDIPLEPGWNSFTLEARDGANNATLTNHQIERTSVQITIDPLGGIKADTYLPTVTGTISAPGYAVWVNGMQAVVSASGPPYTWTATNVPLNDGGTALLQVTAIPFSDGAGSGGGGVTGYANSANPNSPNAVNSQMEVEREPEIVIDRKEELRIRSQLLDLRCIGDTMLLERDSRSSGHEIGGMRLHNWVHKTGGDELLAGMWLYSETPDGASACEGSCPVPEAQSYLFKVSERADVLHMVPVLYTNTSYNPEIVCQGWSPYYVRQVETKNSLLTGGRSLARSYALYRIGLDPNLGKLTDPTGLPPLMGGYMGPIDPGSVRLMNETLTSTLSIYRVLPKGVRLDSTPEFDRGDYTSSPIVYIPFVNEYKVVDLVLNNEPEETEENPGLDICSPSAMDGLIATGMIQFKWPLTGQFGWWQILYSPAYFKVETLVPDPLVPGQIYGPIQLDKSFDILVEAKQPAFRKNITVKFLPLGEKNWLEDRVVITFGHDPDCPCENGRPRLEKVWSDSWQVWLPSEWEYMKGDFPGIQYCHVCIQERHVDPIYNCYAYAGGEDDYFYPRAFMPDRVTLINLDENPDTMTPEELDLFFQARSVPPGQVVYYLHPAQQSTQHIGHVAKVNTSSHANCSATSKDGAGNLFSHDLFEVQGGKWGSILRTNRAYPYP